MQEFTGKSDAVECLAKVCLTVNFWRVYLSTFGVSLCQLLCLSVNFYVSQSTFSCKVDTMRLSSAVRVGLEAGILCTGSPLFEKNAPP